MYGYADWWKIQGPDEEQTDKECILLNHKPYRVQRLTKWIDQGEKFHVAPGMFGIRDLCFWIIEASVSPNRFSSDICHFKEFLKLCVLSPRESPNINHVLYNSHLKKFFFSIEAHNDEVSGWEEWVEFAQLKKLEEKDK